MPVNTPSFENLQTLTGKYGEEGDKLIFRILNNGNYLAKANSEALDTRDSKALTPTISKKALRYDLTVPFARFVVMNRNDLTFPFRRYQIQPVWRGDRPGKGRYQEFTQCDADIIGSKSTLCELDLVQVFSEALTNLGVPDFTIHVNDRRTLSALASSLGVESDKLTDFTTAIDKYDKVGVQGVVDELLVRGFNNKITEGVSKIFEANQSGSNSDVITAIEALIGEDENGQAGLDDLRLLLNRSSSDGIKEPHIRFDAMLARGLDYYTGAIFEVRVKDAPVGSICGGGRYDDLTGIFGWSGMSGVGISFGADRIEDVLEHFDRFPGSLDLTTDILIVNMDDSQLDQELELAGKLRTAGLAAELYPDSSKLKKQMKYADDKSIPFVAIIGEEERAKNIITLKNMESGEQWALSSDELIEKLSS
jgi:histidyl-tRNA synthetase